MQAPNRDQNSTGGTGRSSGLSWSSPAPTSTHSSQPTLLASASTGSKPAATPISATARPTVTTGSTPRSTTHERSGARSVGIFIAGVIVGMLVMWGWDTTRTPESRVATKSSNSSATPTTPDTIGQITSPVIGSTARSASGETWGKRGTTPASNIQVQSPQPAGMSVRITDATVSQPTWLVVFELNDGKPARALGATMFFPEYNGKGGVVSLLRATEPGMTYFVGQALDTGNHTFTPHVNQEILDEDGSMIGVLFTTQ